MIDVLTMFPMTKAVVVTKEHVHKGQSYFSPGPTELQEKGLNVPPVGPAVRGCQEGHTGS